MRTRLGLLTAMMFVLLFTACGGGSSGGGTPLVDDTSDAPDPVETVISLKADAGKDQNVHTTDMVRCDGSASTNTEGATLTYLWRLIERPKGSTVGLTSIDIVNPEFVADLEGSYTVGLTIDDGSTTSTEDMVVIIATTGNAAPVADAGIDQNVNTTSSVTLDGSASSDADHDVLTYLWSFVSRPDGSSATFVDPMVPTLTFITDKDGPYEVELIVDDGTVQSAADSVSIIASTENIPPIAKAGSNQNVSTTAVVTLDGSSSTDTDGDEITYLWSIVSKPTGSTSTLSDAAIVNPTFVADMEGSYVVQLIVDDGTGKSVGATVIITVTTENATPVADAGAEQEVNRGSMVTLDGSGSSDADFDALSYQWDFTYRPEGSSAVLSDPTESAPTFVADKSGTYIIGLIVDDGTTQSIADEITIISIGNSGVLDTTFGADGIITHGNAAGGDGTDIGNAIAVDGAGNVYVTGSSVNSAGNKDMVIWKYRPDGTLDTSFGGDGVVVHYNTLYDDGGQGIAIDSSGDVYVTGFNTYVDGERTKTSVMIWKFKSDGRADRTFSDNGIVTNPGQDVGKAIVLDSDGSIYIMSSTYVWKYRSDGTLITTFGQDGRASHNSPFDVPYGEIGNAMALDSIGNIYVAGYETLDAVDNMNLMIWKFNKDGILDPTFGNDSFFGRGGTVRYSNNEFSRFFGKAISFDSTGKFYIAGYGQEHEYEVMHEMLLWKYMDEGLLDSTFDADGIVTHNLTEFLDSGTSMALDTVGNIYVTGHSDEKMITRKYRSDGSFDTTFGDEGIVIHEGSIRQRYREQVPNAITMDSVGNIYVTSQGKRADGNFDMMIWKYK